MRYLAAYVTGLSLFAFAAAADAADQTFERYLVTPTAVTKPANVRLNSAKAKRFRTAHQPWKTYLQYQGNWTLEVSIGDQSIILSTTFMDPQCRVWSIVFNGMRWTSGSVLPMALIHALDPWLSRMPLHLLTQELREKGEADRPA